jgi:hypothetical protein
MWRVGLQWYLFAVVGIPAITVLGAVVLPGVPVFCLVGHEPSERTAIEHPRNRGCGLYRKPCLQGAGCKRLCSNHFRQFIAG